MKRITRSSIYELLIRIIHKKSYPDIELRNYFQINKYESRERRFITEVVYGVIRWKLKLFYIIEIQSEHKIKNKKIELLLAIAVYQILYLDSVPDYAAVNETVDIAKNRYGYKVAAFINAILRKIIENKDRYTTIQISDTSRYISVNYSFPEWIIKYWSKNMTTEEVVKICNTLNTRPLNTYRVNQLQTSRHSLFEIIPVVRDTYLTSVSPDGFTSTNDPDKYFTELYNDGYISIQNEASQLISIILNPKPHELILDVCSAPGTKSTHIAEITLDKSFIVSCDLNYPRLQLLVKDCLRLGIKSIRELCTDSSMIDKTLKCSFDKILVDAPCSGLGTIRNNPDIKWTKNLNDIKELASLQYKLLDSAAKLIKKGGKLLYSVCTISYLENEDIVTRFLADHSDFEIDACHEIANHEINRLFNRNGYFTSFKNLEIMDGFFAVKFIKSKG